MFDVPNLDGLSVDPADLVAAARVLHLLSRYATHKAEAMRHRLAGRIPGALAEEQECER